MLFYLICFALSAGFIYLGSRKDTIKWFIRLSTIKMVVNPWIIGGLLIPIVIGCLRYGMGIDYASYLEIYQYYADGNVVDWHIDYIETIEPAFQWLARLSYAITGTPLLFFGLPWSATILLIYLGIKRWTPNLSREKFAMAWFLSLPIVTAIGFNQTRQMLAIAILFFASQYLIKLSFKNNFLYAILTICAMLCHQSAVFIALVFLVVRISIRDNGEKADTGYVMMRVVITATIASVIAIAGISMSGVTLPYLSEFSRLLFINGTVSGNLLGIADIRPENVILLSIFLPAVILGGSIGEKVGYIQGRVLSTFCSIGLYLTLMSVFIMNGERLAQYFVIFPILIYYISVSSSKKRKTLTHPLGIFFLIMFLGWQGVLPYHTIYEKEVDINAANSLSIRPPYNQILCNINIISCNDQTYFDKVIREKYEYKEGDLWKLER